MAARGDFLAIRATIAGLSLFWRRPVAVAIWWLMVFASVWVGAGVMMLIGRVAPQWLRRGEVGVLAIVVLAILLSSALIIIAVAAHRSLVHPDDRGFAYLGSGSAGFRAMLTLLAILAMFAAILAVVSGMLLFLARGVRWPNLEAVALTIGVILGLAVSSRFAAAPAYALDTSSFGLAASWRLTRRHPIRTGLASIGAAAVLIIFVGITMAAFVSLTETVNYADTSPSGVGAVALRVVPALALLSLAAVAVPIVLSGPGAYLYSRLNDARIEEVF